jgi:hypothetical protein
MTGFEDARNAIESRLAANWTTTPIRYENVPFKETMAPYLALFILDATGRQISLGTPAVRRWEGIIKIQVFVQADTGTKLPRTYADTVGAIFDRAQFSAGSSGTIRCRIPSAVHVGVTNGWDQVSVTIPFIRDRQY